MNLSGHEDINHRPRAEKSGCEREPLLDAAEENGGAAEHRVMWSTQTRPPTLQRCSGGGGEAAGERIFSFQLKCISIMS